MSTVVHWLQVLAIVAGIFLAAALIAHYIAGFRR